MPFLFFNSLSKKYSVKKTNNFTSKKCIPLAFHSCCHDLEDISYRLNRGLPKIQLSRIHYGIEKKDFNKFENDKLENDQQSVDEILKIDDKLKILENGIKHQNSHLDLSKSINENNHKVINAKLGYKTDNSINEFLNETRPTKGIFDLVFHTELEKNFNNHMGISSFKSKLNTLTTEISRLNHQEGTIESNRFSELSLSKNDQTNLSESFEERQGQSTALIIDEKNFDVSANNLLDSECNSKSNPSDQIILKPYTQHHDDEDMVTEFRQDRSYDDSYFADYDKEEIASEKIKLHHKIDDSTKLLNQNCGYDNNEGKSTDNGPEKQNIFEDVLLPHDLDEIQTLYDSEKDILTYSSNYQISDKLDEILSYQLDGRTVEEIRDDNTVNDNDVLLLSPISLHRGEDKNNSSGSQIYTDDNDSYGKELDIDSTISDLVRSSVNDSKISTQLVDVDDNHSEIVSNELLNETQHDNIHMNTNSDVPGSNVLRNIDTTTQKGSCDNSQLIVQQSNIPRWKKEYSCPFCHKIIIGQLPRHIKTVHRELKDVKKLNSTSKGTQERKQILTTFRNHGTFTHNSDKNFNKGQLIVSRRPKTEKKATDYTSCPFCLATYAKANARKHILKCRKKHGEDGKCKGQRIYYVMGKAIEARLHCTANDILRLVVFPVLQEDDIVRLIRYDWLIILYGNKLCIKYTPHYQHNMIRARLRLIGRFLFAAQQLNSAITELAAVFHPKLIDTVIKAIGSVAKINYLKNTCEAPAVALNLVTYLKQIAVILETEYVMREDEQNQKHVANFLKVYNTEMSIAVNKIACESQANLRRHKIIVLPVTEDIQKFIIYLKTQMKKCFDILEKTYHYQTWLTASKLVAAYLLVFNRRRVGDIQNMTLLNMNKLQKIDKNADKEEFNALDDEGKKIAANYQRIEIRGKLNRDVAVIASTDLITKINLLIKYRELANVPADNQFVFGLPSGVNDRIRVLNLCATMRELSVSCGAEKPELLRGTHLRKHVATKCIEFELSDNVLSDLTKHMGHSDKIHKDFYQKPIKSKTIIQVTKLLHAVHGPVDDDDIESEDVYTNDLSEYVEYDDAGKTGTNENVEGNPSDSNSETNLIYDGYLPNISSELPAESEILFDNNLPSTSNGSSSFIADIQAQFNNQSTPKGKSLTSLPSEFCTTKKKPWSADEKRIILSEFREHMIKRTLPSLKKIDELKEKYPILNDRRRDTIKTWISNQYKKKEKSSDTLNKRKGIALLSNKRVHYKMKCLSKDAMDL